MVRRGASFFCDPCGVEVEWKPDFQGCRCAQPLATVWHPCGMLEGRPPGADWADLEMGLCLVSGYGGD